MKTEVEEKIKALKEIESSAPVDEVKQKTEELSAVLSKIGESMYQKKGPEGTEGTEGADGADDAKGTEDKKDEKAKDDSGEVQEGEVVKE